MSDSPPKALGASSDWLVEGRRDPELGRWVVDLITQEDSPRGGESGLAVYLDEEFAVQWYNLNSTARDFPADFSSILNDIVQLETLSESLRKAPSRDKEKDFGRRLDEKKEMDFTKMKRRHPQLRAARRLLGEALARAYGPAPSSEAVEDQRSVAAKTAIGMAKEYIRSRSSDFGRAYVIGGALFCAILCLIITMVVGWIYGESRDGVLDQLKVEQTWNPQVAGGTKGETAVSLTPEDAARLHHAANTITRTDWDLIRFSAMGAAGAMLSLLTLSSKREYDAGAGRGVFVLEGAVRIFVGVLGALLITLAIKSELLLPFLSKDTATASAGDKGSTAGWMPLFFGFLAGASERFVPSFLSVVEAQVQSGGTKQ